MTDPQYKVGTYRLKTTITNPSPDRRHRHDWRLAESWKEGQLFHLDNGVYGWSIRSNSSSRTINLDVDPRFTLIYNNLEIVVEQPRIWLLRNGWAHMGDDIIQNLFEKGKFTMDEFLQAASEELEKD